MTATEQEYIKHIYQGIPTANGKMHTRELANLVEAKPPSVTDMIKRLTAKGLVDYQKSYGFSLSAEGQQQAIQIIRRHRLWEVFLTEKLGINWKEVHLIACQLQSIDINLLVDALESYLGHPVYDPHGEAIPDAHGNFPYTERTEVYDLKLNEAATVTGFRESGRPFLEYMEKIKLLIGNQLKIISMIDYNQSIEIVVDDQHTFIISKETAQKIYVKTGSEHLQRPS